MVLVSQAALVTALLVALARWLRRRRALRRIQRRFVDALLRGDYRRADLEAALWFSAARRSRPLLAGPGPGSGRPDTGSRRPGEASPGNGLTAG